jgi:hypothetical protein
VVTENAPIVMGREQILQDLELAKNAVAQETVPFAKALGNSLNSGIDPNILF